MDQESSDFYYETDYRNVLQKIDNLLSSQMLYSKTAEQKKSSSKTPSVRCVSKPNKTAGFQKNIQIVFYKHDEIDVETVDGFVVIRGKHEEKPDEHGFVSRDMTRRIKIPDNVDPEDVTYCMEDDLLTIMAPLKEVDALPPNERIVPIVVDKPSRRF